MSEPIKVSHCALLCLVFFTFPLKTNYTVTTLSGPGGFLWDLLSPWTREDGRLSCLCCAFAVYPECSFPFLWLLLSSQWQILTLFFRAQLRSFCFRKPSLLLFAEWAYLLFVCGISLGSSLWDWMLVPRWWRWCPGAYASGDCRALLSSEWLWMERVFSQWLCCLSTAFILSFWCFSCCE